MVTADVTACGRARMPLGEAVRALWRAPRSVLGCAAVCGGGQDEMHCGGQVHPPAGVDDVRMGACSGPHPVRDDPLRIGSTLRAHGCRLATSLRRARGRWGMPTVGRSRRRRSRALWPTRRAGQWSRPGGVGEQDPRVDLSLDPRSAAPLCSGRGSAR